MGAVIFFFSSHEFPRRPSLKRVPRIVIGSKKLWRPVECTALYNNPRRLNAGEKNVIFIVHLREKPRRWLVRICCCSFITSDAAITEQIQTGIGCESDLRVCLDFSQVEVHEFFHLTLSPGSIVFQEESRRVEMTADCWWSCEWCL